MVGVVRYSVKGLQLCTQVGWRNIALDINPPHCPNTANIPEHNLQAFYNGNPGIMFQFNNDTKPMVNPSNFNITAGLWNVFIGQVKPCLKNPQIQGNFYFIPTPIL